MAAGAIVLMSANVTGAPNSSVIGANGRASPRMDVLAIRFTPSGALSWSVKIGESPWVNNRAACVSTHSKNTWSWSLSSSILVCGAAHRWWNSTTENTT